MVLENLMYFALGLLIAVLGALVIVPAIWRRAVRLTKKRIEAATPISMAEFRADKDQLRAEFALSTRRLEMIIERLRRRLADQLRDVSRSRTEMDSVEGERSRHQQIIEEFEARESGQRQRVLDLEKEVASLSQQLRMRERELAEKATQLDTARESLRNKSQRVFRLDGETLAGDYNADVELLLARLDDSNKQVAALSQQVASLSQKLVAKAPRPADPATATADLKAELQRAETTTSLETTEARLADAEARVSSLLAETVANEGDSQGHLAEKLEVEAATEAVRAKVAAIEADVLASTASEETDARFRNRLSEIASDVSRLVNALDEDDDEAPSQSLYERVQKFVGAIDEVEAEKPSRPQQPANAVSDRLKALQEMQEGR